MAHNSAKKDPSETGNRIENHSNDICAFVNAGICGFTCRIRAWKIDKRSVGLTISESDCQQIQNFSEALKTLTVKELFAPATRNPVYRAAERSSCHPSCPVPAAVLKAAEVAMEMALPQDAVIQFVPCKGEIA